MQPWIRRLKHNRRLKQRDSLPLNAARGAGGSELRKSPSIWSRSKAPVGVWGKKSPEAEAFCTFAHNTLTPHGQKLGVSRHRGNQWLTPLLRDLGLFPQRGQGQSPCSGSLRAKPHRSWKLFAAQAADFCLTRRFFLGIWLFGGIFPLRMPRINND